MLPKEAIQKLRDQFQAQVSQHETCLSEAKAQLAFVDELEATVDAQIGDLQTKVDAIPQLLIDAERKGYDQRMSEEGTINGPDKVFSNEEFEAELALRLKPIQDQITSAQSEIEALKLGQALDKEKVLDLQAQIDAKTEALPGLIDVAKSEAVAAFKLEIKAKYEEQQVAETSSETGFKDLLG